MISVKYLTQHWSCFCTGQRSATVFWKLDMAVLSDDEA